MQILRFEFSDLPDCPAEKGGSCSNVIYYNVTFCRSRKNLELGKKIFFRLLLLRSYCSHVILLIRELLPRSGQRLKSPTLVFGSNPARMLLTVFICVESMGLLAATFDTFNSTNRV